MRVNLKIRNDSGIPQAIVRLRADGISANAYAIDALKEKLRRDGYLQEQVNGQASSLSREEKME